VDRSGEAERVRGDVDTTKLIAAHEAGHATACYVLGVPIDTVQAWNGDGRNQVRSDFDHDWFDLARIALAGRAFIEHLGLTPLSDNAHDRKVAAECVFKALVSSLDDDRADLDQEVGVAVMEFVEQATRELVSTDRFRGLALDLSCELAQRNWIFGPEAERFLYDRDPHIRILRANGLAPSALAPSALAPSALAPSALEMEGSA
jgi:hypothetical protein